ncbi:MAG: tetratricopeptide repeat protein [Cyanobacteria bacterium P01_A01_bin.123]
MKTAIGFWMAVILTGLGLLLAQPAYASDIQGCHLLSSNGFRPAKISAYLPKAHLDQLKFAFVTGELESPKPGMHHYLESLKQPKVAALKRSISANPHNIAAWNNLGHELFSLKHYAEALAIYDHALMISPKYSLGLANRCGVLSKLGKYAQALRSCNLALVGDGRWGVQGSELAWDNRGDVLFNLQRYSESLRSFEQALIINSNYKNAQLNQIIVSNYLAQILDKINEENHVRSFKPD